MKIKQHKKWSTKITLLVLVLVLIGTGVFAYFWLNRDSVDQASTTDTSKPSQEQVDSGNNAKEETINKNNPENSKPSSSASDTPAPTPEGTLTVSIPYADSSRLTVLIEDVVTGTCDLKLTNGSAVITNSAPISSGPSSSTCQGFTYNTLSSGTWTATVSVTTPSSKGTATKAITVQ